MTPGLHTTLHGYRVSPALCLSWNVCQASVPPECPITGHTGRAHSPTEHSCCPASPPAPWVGKLKPDRENNSAPGPSSGSLADDPAGVRPLIASGSLHNKRHGGHVIAVAGPGAASPEIKGPRGMGPKSAKPRGPKHVPWAPAPTSGQGQGFGQAGPEPGLGAGVGIVAHGDKPQDAGELLLHGLVLDGDQSLLMGTCQPREQHWHQAQPPAQGSPKTSAGYTHTHTHLQRTQTLRSACLLASQGPAHLFQGPGSPGERLRANFVWKSHSLLCR